MLVTGPTGSGKTTTLYAALAELNDIEQQDPHRRGPRRIRHRRPHARCQVNTEIGLDVRQAPPLASCVRTRTSSWSAKSATSRPAQIAVQASLTGHLVLSTLHTNDAPAPSCVWSTSGVEPFLLTATHRGHRGPAPGPHDLPQVQGDVHAPKEEELMELVMLDARTSSGRRLSSAARGCDNCNNSGYKGRMAIFEIMAMNDEMRELVMKHASTNILLRDARPRGGHADAARVRACWPSTKGMTDHRRSRARDDRRGLI